MSTNFDVEGDFTFLRELSSAEASKLVAQPGVRVEPTGNSVTIWSDDVLFNFWLSDGTCVEYKAEHESDYYGGYYVNIKWSLWNFTPRTAPEQIHQPVNSPSLRDS